MPRLKADASTGSIARVLPPRGLLDLVRGVVQEGGSLWVQVTGISMNPVIRDGDSVLLAGLARGPRRGDVVFLDVGGCPLLHRVTRAESGQIVTRGDAARTDDAPVLPEACVAHALAARRGGVTVALTPTLRFGVKALLWFVAWRIRLHVPPPMAPRVQPLSRAITPALS